MPITAKPTSQTRWATDLQQVSEPTGSKKTIGFNPSEAPPNQTHNWLFNNQGQWEEYFENYLDTITNSGISFDDVNGRIGIGTSTPNRSLHISKVLQADMELSSTGGSSRSVYFMKGHSSSTSLTTVSGGSGIVMQNNDNTDGNYCSIHINDSDGQATSAIVGQIVSHTNNEGSLSFLTRPNLGSLTEWLTISGIGLVRPATDGTQDFGSASFRWQDIWATNGTIQTSDERLKDNILPCSLGLDFINKFDSIQWKWKDIPETTKTETVTKQKTEKVTKVRKKVSYVMVDSKMTEVVEDETYEADEPIYTEHLLFDSNGDPILDDNGEQKIHKEPVMEEVEETITIPSQTFLRTHYGVSAQQVKSVLDELSIDTQDFAPLIYDDETDRYAFRYNEMVGILIKAIQDLSAKVTALESA